MVSLIGQGREEVSRFCRKSTDNIEDAFDNVANLVAFGMGASVKRCLFLRRAKYIEWEFFAWECEFANLSWEREFVVGNAQFIKNFPKLAKPCPRHKNFTKLP